MPAKLTTTEFIRRAKEQHGDRYDYSETEYVNADHKIAIRCKVHGIFRQRAADHTRGFGCSLCNEKQKETTKSFTAKAIAKHGKKYKYTNVDYVNTYTKIVITCPVHGNFSQVPKDHLAGYGCPDCGGVKKVTTERFIERATLVHNTKYKYHLVNLKGMNMNVEIECPHHGIFSQRPADHLNGSGCPECGKLKQGTYTQEHLQKHPERANVPAFLYLIKIDDEYCKIGITTKKYIKQRFPSTQFEIMHAIHTTLQNAMLHEANLLSTYAEARYKVHNLKQTRIKGWTECFPLELLSTLKEEFEHIKNNTAAKS